MSGQKPITREGEYIVIRLPVSKAHSLRVALADCPCKAAKSNATANIRKWLAGELAKAEGAK